MKLVAAVIKPFKLDEVREALSAIGVQGITVTSGNLTVSGTNSSFVGDVAINGGVVTLSGGNSRLGASASAAVAGGAVLNVGGNSQTFGVLTGTGTVTNSAGTITLGVMQQIVRAFGRVEMSFQFLVRSWSTIVELISVYKRLRAFEATIDTTPTPPASADRNA